MRPAWVLRGRVVWGRAAYTPAMPSFADLSLHPALLEATERLGFHTPTPIQQQVLPAILGGRDLIARAKTGSGKTAAFGLGLLHRLPAGARPGPPVAVVLGPTRELVEQVAEALRQLAQCLPNTRIVSLCGGHPIRPQKNALEQGVHVVVGTPGRVLDHIERGHLDLTQVGTLVLDEVDRMLDMGFVDQVTELVAHCPAQRRTWVLSATMPEAIDSLCRAILQDPVAVSVDTVVAAESLRQEVVHCPRALRFEAVATVLGHHDPKQALVFCETRLDCDDLCDFLSRLGAPVLALHGGLEQRERDDVWVQFANGSARYLVATDLAARGLDIQSLPLVVQAELSPDPEVHVHRVGRTARAGEDGLAVSIVASQREEMRLDAVEASLGQRLPVVPVTLDAPPRFQPPRFRTLLLLAGRKDKLRKGDVVGALVKDAGVPPECIGDIHLTRRTCAVAIERDHARRALRQLRRGRVKKQRVRVTLLGD